MSYTGNGNMGMWERLPQVTHGSCTLPLADMQSFQVAEQAEPLQGTCTSLPRL